MRPFHTCLLLVLLLSACHGHDAKDHARDGHQAADAQDPQGIAAAHDEHSDHAHDGHDDEHDGHDAHRHHGEGEPVLLPAPATPWAADAALTEGMNRLHAAVANALSQPELDAAAAAHTAQQVEDGVAYLIANCRLEPEADAALHALIAGLLSGAAALREDPASETGLPRLQAMLEAYPRYFAQPGWVAPGAG